MKGKDDLSKRPVSILKAFCNKKAEAQLKAQHADAPEEQHEEPLLRTRVVDLRDVLLGLPAALPGEERPEAQADLQLPGVHTVSSGESLDELRGCNSSYSGDH